MLGYTKGGLLVFHNYQKYNTLSFLINQNSQSPLLFTMFMQMSLNTLQLCFPMKSAVSALVLIIENIPPFSLFQSCVPQAPFCIVFICLVIFNLFIFSEEVVIIHL